MPATQSLQCTIDETPPRGSSSTLQSLGHLLTLEEQVAHWKPVPPDNAVVAELVGGVMRYVHLVYYGWNRATLCRHDYAMTGTVEETYAFHRRERLRALLAWRVDDVSLAEALAVFASRSPAADRRGIVQMRLTSTLYQH
jgi:hypothetical protein